MINLLERFRLPLLARFKDANNLCYLHTPIKYDGNGKLLLKLQIVDCFLRYIDLYISNVLVYTFYILCKFISHDRIFFWVCIVYVYIYLIIYIYSIQLPLRPSCPPCFDVIWLTLLRFVWSRNFIRGLR